MSVINNFAAGFILGSTQPTARRIQTIDEVDSFLSKYNATAQIKEKIITVTLHDGFNLNNDVANTFFENGNQINVQIKSSAYHVSVNTGNGITIATSDECVQISQKLLYDAVMYRATTITEKPKSTEKKLETELDKIFERFSQGLSNHQAAHYSRHTTPTTNDL